MAFFVHFYLLLGFLVFPVVYTKRSREDVSNEENASLEDSRKETDYDLEDMTNIKSKIKDLTDKGVIDRVERGQPVSHKDFKDLQEIKEEFESYFDEDSGNSLKEGLEEVVGYLEEEINSLSENNPSEGSSTPVENNPKKAKTQDDTDLDLPVEMPSIFDDLD